MDRRHFIASMIASAISMLCFWRKPETARLVWPLKTTQSRMAGNLDAMGSLDDGCLTKWIEREVKAVARKLRPNTLVTATWAPIQHNLILVHIDEILGQGRVLTCKFVVHINIAQASPSVQRAALRVRTMDAMSERVERSLFDPETDSSIAWTGQPLFA